MYVAIKYINGKKLAWYVDGNTISHTEQIVADNIIQKIEDRFPVLTVNQGDDHNFLRTKLRYFRNKEGVRDGKTSINMKAYTKEVTEEFGEDATKVGTSSGAIWLFTVGKARLLKEDRLDNLCLIVTKLL